MRSVLTALLMICLVSTAHTADFTETFESVQDGALISSGSIQDWSQIQKTDDNSDKVIVRAKAGYNGSKGLALESHGAFAEWLSDQAAWHAADGTAEFSVDFCLTGEVSQLNVVVSQYGYSGFWIGIEPQEIKVSTGGKTAFEPSTQSCAATIEPGKWYTLVIKDIALSDSVTREPISGMLYIYETSKPANTLLDGIKIKAAGQDRPFSSINQIDFRRFGGVTDEVHVQLDNVHIGACKKQLETKRQP